MQYGVVCTLHGVNSLMMLLKCLPCRFWFIADRAAESVWQQRGNEYSSFLAYLQIRKKYIYADLYLVKYLLYMNWRGKSGEFIPSCATRRTTHIECR